MYFIYLSIYHDSPFQDLSIYLSDREPISRVSILGPFQIKILDKRGIHCSSERGQTFFDFFKFTNLISNVFVSIFYQKINFFFSLSSYSFLQPSYCSDEGEENQFFP